MNKKDQKLYYIAQTGSKDDRLRIAAETDNVEILGLLLCDRTLAVRGEVLKNPHIPWKMLAEVAHSSNTGLKNMLIERVNDTKILMILASEYDQERPLASDKDALIKYRKMTAKTVIARMCKTTGLPQEVYYRLAERKDWTRIEYLYENPSCPTDILNDALNRYSDIAMSAKDGLRKSNRTMAIHILASVASNPSTDTDTVMKLIDFPLDYVRYFAVSNPKVGQDILRKMASDLETDTRTLGSILDNPNVPDDVVIALSDSVVPWIATKATVLVEKRQLRSLNGEKKENQSAVASHTEETLEQDDFEELFDTEEAFEELFDDDEEEENNPSIPLNRSDYRLRQQVDELPPEYLEMMVTIYQAINQRLKDYSKKNADVKVKNKNPEQVLRWCISNVCTEIKKALK